MQPTDDMRVSLAPDDGSAPARLRTPRLRSKWLWIAMASVLVLAGAITAASLTLRYAHAPNLSTGSGGYGWYAPDNLATHSVDVGPYHAFVTVQRPGKRQAFFFTIHNESSVTQTILGASGGSGYLRPRIDLGNPGSTSPIGARYQAVPVSVAPHQYLLVRFSFLSPPCQAIDRFWWENVGLRVRAGWFTRTEKVSLNMIFEIRKSARYC
jgi:hypothetical protein